MNELKPCPFCGGEAVKLTSIDGFTSIGCLNCNPFYGVMIQRNAEAEAIAAWNSRAERTCKVTKEFVDIGGEPMTDYSCCFNQPGWGHNYCPNCGSKVVGE